MVVKPDVWAGMRYSEDDNCTTITIERGTKYYQNLGDSASLECPVTYSSKKPKMNWYMLNKNEEKFHILNNETERSIFWKNENKFVLQFQSVHKNDSGQYRCEAIVRKNNLASHVVELIVQVKNTQKVKSQESGNNRKTQHCTDSTTHESDEGAIFNEDFMPCLFQVPSGNQDNYQKASRTSPSSMKFNEGLPGYKEDSVIYTTLSHGELFQRTKPPEETQLTEYAIIRLKN
ncbi:hypothetical protein E2320_005249 [Naja naja]|nr:hypothetical protein E2320_005249 [Naja naja]